MWIIRYAAGVLVAVVMACSCATVPAQQSADLVMLGGKIVTVEKGQPEVEAMAVRGERIVALGTDEQIREWIGDSTRIIQLHGRLAIPGFIEGHGHFTGLGYAKMMLDLKRAKTWDDIVRQVAAAATKVPAGTWIVGRGWHQAKWDEKPVPNIDGYPTHDELSRVAPNHPVLLTHASGHMSFANAEAMRLAGVDATTKNPSGGEILKDTVSNPIGVFRETAQGLVSRARQADLRKQSPEERAAELTKAIQLATQECLSKGVTSFQDAGSSFGTIDVFKKMAEKGRLNIRLWVMIRESNPSLAQLLPRYRMINHGDHYLTVRGIKRSLDGALGPHGAWLLAPYEDLPNSVGLNTASIESVRETARLALLHDYQLCVHAIGDRANRETLDIFQQALSGANEQKDRRWRVEHAQHLHPDDVPRFAELGVIASMQGIHCTSDAIYVIQRLGMRRAASGAYVWQSLIKSGAVVTNGTDAPVEDVSPIESFYATVTRKLPNGTAFFPEQCMTRQQALESYTLNAAYAAFEEKDKGSLAIGKLADIVVLSKDIMTIPEEEILSTKVMYTIVGGKVRFQKQQ